MRQHAQPIVARLHLADHDEVCAKGVANGDEVAEGSIGAQDRRVPDHREASIIPECEHDRVRQRLRHALEILASGFIVEPDDGNAGGRRRPRVPGCADEARDDRGGGRN
jgi:hypothetical protein